MLQLQLAAEIGFTLVMNLLLTTGEACVNRTDGAGNTALYFATQAGKESMVVLLKKHGAISEKVVDSEIFGDALATEPSSDGEEVVQDLPLVGEGAV
jgi:ankyrin repeat protein